MVAGTRPGIIPGKVDRDSELGTELGEPPAMREWPEEANVAAARGGPGGQSGVARRTGLGNPMPSWW